MHEYLNVLNAGNTIFDEICDAEIDKKDEICPKCGVRNPGSGSSLWLPICWLDSFYTLGERYTISMTERVERAKVPESPRNRGLTVDERRNLSDSMKRHHKAMERLSKL